jgi:hypothetical protein
MKHRLPSAFDPLLLSAAAALVLVAWGCGLFEPRSAQDPSSPSLDYRPAPDAATVISNLQSAISQQSETNYIRCFADPATTPRPFVFDAAADGLAQYGSLFTAWSRTDELAYFRNLAARTGPTGTSDLQLTEKSPPAVSADSTVYYYDYILRFDHNDPTFPKIGRGTLQFTLGADNNGQWMIYRWIDVKSTNDITWSVFKGKFSN